MIVWMYLTYDSLTTAEIKKRTDLNHSYEHRTYVSKFASLLYSQPIFEKRNSIYASIIYI